MDKRALNVCACWDLEESVKAEPDREREGRITPVKSGVWFLRWMVRRNRKRSARGLVRSGERWGEK